MSQEMIDVFIWKAANCDRQTITVMMIIHVYRHLKYYKPSLHKLQCVSRNEHTKLMIYEILLLV